MKGLFTRRDEDHRNWKPEWTELANYNTRVSQGVMHRPDYMIRMEEVQRDFDENYTGNYMGERA